MAPRDGGRMRYRVTFWTPNRSADDSGQEVEHPEIVIEDVPAAVKPTGGDERRLGNQYVADTTHIIKTRFLQSVETLPNMFITRETDPPLGGRLIRYDILRTTDVDGLRRFQEHWVKELSLDGYRDDG